MSRRWGDNSGFETPQGWRKRLSLSPPLTHGGSYIFLRGEGWGEGATSTLRRHGMTPHPASPQWASWALPYLRWGEGIRFEAITNDKCAHQRSVVLPHSLIS